VSLPLVRFTIAALRALFTPAPTPSPQFDFGGALATRLAELVKARLVVPGSLLWRNAVDLLLVRMVDSHPQVREGQWVLAGAVAELLARSVGARSRVGAWEQEVGGAAWGEEVRLLCRGAVCLPV